MSTQKYSTIPPNMTLAQLSKIQSKSKDSSPINKKHSNLTKITISSDSLNSFNSSLTNLNDNFTASSTALPTSFSSSERTSKIKFPTIDNVMTNNFNTHLSMPSQPSQMSKIQNLKNRKLNKKKLNLFAPGKMENKKTLGGKTHMRNASLPIDYSQFKATKAKKDAKIKENLNLMDQIDGQFNIPNYGKIKASLNNFQNIKRIGEGTSGVVFLKQFSYTCQNGQKLEELVAVKEIQRSGNSEELKRMLRDMAIHQSIENFTYIVRWYGLLKVDEYTWLVMNYCHYGDLDNLIKKVKSSKNFPVVKNTCQKIVKVFTQKRAFLPEFVIGQYCKSIILALDYLKTNHDTIHRDVKPSNVLIDNNGVFKLCDFGLATVLEDSKAFTRCAGVKCYLSPERIKASESDDIGGYGVESDVYAFGLTTFEVTAGYHPTLKNFQNEFSIYNSVSQPSPVLPQEIVNKLDDDELNNFINYCLTYDPLKRPKYKDLLNSNYLKKWTNLSVDRISSKFTKWFVYWINNGLDSCEDEILRECKDGNVDEMILRNLTIIKTYEPEDKPIQNQKISRFNPKPQIRPKISTSNISTIDSNLDPLDVEDTLTQSIPMEKLSLVSNVVPERKNLNPLIKLDPKSKNFKVNKRVGPKIPPRPNKNLTNRNDSSKYSTGSSGFVDSSSFNTMDKNFNQKPESSNFQKTTISEKSDTVDSGSGSSIKSRHDKWEKFD